MRYMIIGAGGTGGAIGAFLARAGFDVTLIARGEHLSAIREKGLLLHHPDGDLRWRISSKMAGKHQMWHSYA